MDEKRRIPWLLVAAIHSLAWGMMIPILRPLVQPTYHSVGLIACVVIAFAPFPFAFWFECRNRGTSLPKWQFATICALTAALIVAAAIGIVLEND
jgi:hypothetical protein